MSRLYIVSTPIGNLSDLTLRAIEVLRGVDRILAEDTRRTGILCKRHGIETSLVSAHEHNEASRAEQAMGWLEAGETLALVTDAGTPVLSDPGARLVSRVVEAGHEVVPVPGASALLAALVGSGLGGEPFTFYGFLPRSGRARRDGLGEVLGLPHTAVLYENPARLVSLLEELASGSSAGRRVVVARELTKVHEEFRRGTLSEVAAYYSGAGVKGEVVVVLEGAAPASGAVDEEAGSALAGALLAEGGRPSAVAREVARRLGIGRNQAYEIVQRLKGESAES